MTPVLKRFLKKDLGSKKRPLPKALVFLEGVKFFVIAEQKVNGTRKWHVELPASSLKKLLSAKAKLQTIQESHAKLQKDFEEAVEECKNIYEQNAALQAVNEKLIQNIDEDKRPEYYKKSSRNYFNVAENRLSKLRWLRTQGGLVGLNKK